MAALALFKPTLPGWLPGLVLNAFQAVRETAQLNRIACRQFRALCRVLWNFAYQRAGTERCSCCTSLSLMMGYGLNTKAPQLIIFWSKLGLSLKVIFSLAKEANAFREYVVPIGEVCIVAKKQETESGTLEDEGGSSSGPSGSEGGAESEGGFEGGMTGVSGEGGFSASGSEGATSSEEGIDLGRWFGVLDKAAEVAVDVAAGVAEGAHAVESHGITPEVFVLKKFLNRHPGDDDGI